MSKKHKKIFSLLSARHDGALDDEGEKQLAGLLENDPDAQLYYLKVHRMFHDLEVKYLGHCADTLVQEFSVKRSKVVPITGWTLALAASLMVAFLLVPKSGTKRSAMLVNEDSTRLLTDESSFVARVVESSNVEWGQDNTVQIYNGELTPGLLDLQRGSLDVVFDNGVRFGLVAPVQMDLASLQRLTLHSGELVMNVPGLAEGLTINTPDAALKVHTAHAQITCGLNEGTAVNMVSGAIDLYTENEAHREVHQHLVRTESVKIARGAPEPVIASHKLIERRIDLSQPPKLENLQYAHYSFDESRESQVKNHGNVPNADGWLEGISAYPEYPEPRRVPGRFKRALEFSGHGEGMIADLKDFGTDEPGSVAFWIKLDPETVPSEFDNIFTWHMYTWPKKEKHHGDERELVSRIRINQSASEGVVGAVRIAFRNGWICGSTDLRDGRWHHVTAVFHRGPHGPTLRHYIDGTLARASARGETWFSRERYPDIGGGSIAVGRSYWAGRPDTVSRGDSFGLRGMVDELYVFNQAVLPSHASSLHMKNSPNQMVDVSFVPWPRASLAMLQVPPFSSK